MSGPKCACGAELTGEEIQYYGNTCEACEKEAMREIQLEQVKAKERLEQVHNELYHDGKPLMIFQPDPKLLITFHHDGREVGKMWCDEDGKLQFDGELEASADRLFTLIKQLWDAR